MILFGVLTQNGRLLSCHLPTPRKTLEGRAARPWYHPHCRIRPGHSIGVCRAWAPPPPPTCIAAFFGGPLRGAFRTGIAMGLPPSPTRLWLAYAYSSPSSRASSIVQRTLAPIARSVKANRKMKRGFEPPRHQGHQEHGEEKGCSFRRLLPHLSCALYVLGVLAVQSFRAPTHRPTASERIGRCAAGFHPRGRRGCIRARSSRRTRCRAVRGKPP